jgi:hypothetical protein
MNTFLTAWLPNLVCSVVFGSHAQRTVGFARVVSQRQHQRQSKAIEFDVLAANRGGFLPCLHLACIHATGKGVPRSSSIAAEWYRRVLAAESEVDDNGEMTEASNFLAQAK